MKCTFCVVLSLFLANIFFAQNTNVLVKNKERSPSEIILAKTQKSFDLSINNRANEGLELALEALEEAKEINNDMLKGHSYNSIGISLQVLGNLKEALNNVKKAKSIYSNIKSNNNVITANNNIGVIFREIGQIDSSNVYFENALKTASRIENENEKVLPNFNLGHNYNYYHKDHAKALYYLNKSLLTLRSLKHEFVKNEQIEGEIYHDLGIAYAGLKNTELANLYYDKAINYGKANGYLDILSETYESKIDLYNELDDQAMLNSNFLELLKIKDSIRVISNQDLSREIEAKYRLKENKAKIEFVEKEKIVQKELLDKSTVFNMFLVILMTILIFTAYWIYTKNKELKLAKDRAERLSEIKSHFYSEISHELRTPLYAVIELSNLLLKENVNVKHREYLESLKFSGNHLLSLINNVLQLNKVESGEMQLQELNFDLKELITNIIDSLEYALRDSGNKISLNYDYNIPKGLVGDSLKLSQIFINLISNAIKFTNNGTIDITISEIDGVQNENETKIFFRVKDDGIGIPLDKQDKIFEDFYQELAENENSYKGTGLGLSIVKRTLDAMNSNIKIESEEGKGTAFFFEIAFKKLSLENCEEVICMDELDLIRGYKILIVDDNKINQLVTKKVLDQLEVQCKVVGSGKAAIEIVKQEYFDCILMDIHMPEMDGYETSKYIREFNRDIAIVALTAASSEEVESKINNYEMDGYVLKPFVLSDFISTITSSVNKNNRFTA